MADLKISQLTGATTPLIGTEVLPIVQSGATKQVSVANLTAGRTQTSNGIVQGSAATGYNFTANANAPGMTSQLLNWYEEGTWTPVVTDGTTDVSMASGAGWYIRVGKTVTIGWNSYALDVSSINATNQLRLKTLPFTAGDKDSWGAAAFPYDNSGKNYGWRVPANNTQLYFVVTGASSVDWADCSRTTLGGTSVSFFGTATYRCA